MLIAAGITTAWPSTAATIPSGWSRVASLDGVYPKGTAAGVDPGVTGGATTHTHTETGHTHTETAHTHVLGTSSAASPSAVDGASGTPNMTDASHTHTITTPSGSGSATSSSTTATWLSGSNEPAFGTVVWVESDGTPTGFPSGSWALWDDAGALPTGWTNPAAMQNVFPKGAAAAADAGTTGGGAHAHTANAHTHTFDNHTHSGGTSGAAATGSTQVDGIGPTVALTAHTHTYSLSAGATQSGSATSSASGSTSYEPTWTKLAVVQNDTGGQDIQVRHIGLWLGLLSAIPENWLLCDGSNGTIDMRGQFLKGANGVAEIGDVGGSAGHLHTSGTHTHASNHTHSAPLAPTAAGSGLDSGVGAIAVATYAHTHGAAVTAYTGTSGATAQAVDTTADTQPPWRTVAFIVLASNVLVTVTAPTASQVLLVPEFTVSWTLSGGTGVQNDRQVKVYESDGTTVLYDSGVVATAVQTVDLGLEVGLRTGRTYYVDVTLHDTSGTPLLGTSSKTLFTTAWTPPPTITGLRAVAITGEEV